MKPAFEDNNVVVQAHILSYSMIRELEDLERLKLMIPHY